MKFTKMRKQVKVSICLFLVTLIFSVVALSFKKEKSCYNTTATIRGYNYITSEIVVELYDGNQYAYQVENIYDYINIQSVQAKVNTKGTDDVLDDEIVDIKI